ncbi:MAG: 3-deoxy-D-manno-octulosonic acid kinase [Lysobacterales bacterium]
MLHMKHETYQERSWAVAYDASLMQAPCVEYFSVDYWRSLQALTGQAVGRGSAWFIQAPYGPVVLRRYLRGGWAAVVSREHYFYTGASTSRPFREYHLLAAMHAMGLPVPRPVAALCRHRGFLSTGAIMTLRLVDAEPLADLLVGGQCDADAWAGIGACIRRFHEAGVWHADLNARNILLDGDSKVFLIDFDRARFDPVEGVDGMGNLKRLKRSLVKLWPAGDSSAMQVAWENLMAGYDE